MWVVAVVTVVVAVRWTSDVYVKEKSTATVVSTVDAEAAVVAVEAVAAAAAVAFEMSSSQPTTWHMASK